MGGKDLVQIHVCLDAKTQMLSELSIRWPLPFHTGDTEAPKY